MIKLKDLIKESKVVNGISLDDYANDFQSYIEKKYKTKPILMWKLYVDSMVGTFYWYKKDSDIEVLATPYWEGEENVPVDIQNTKTDEYISQKKYPLKFTGDMKKDEAEYIEIVRKVLSKLK